jgi:hypothetical protein
MSRYSQIPIITTPLNLKRRYINVKYPEIPRDNLDIYLYTTKGDRYDLMAQTYYNDSSLWWIISLANAFTHTPDSLFPTPGNQIRVPSPTLISKIIGQYENLNQMN